MSFSSTSQRYWKRSQHWTPDNSPQLAPREAPASAAVSSFLRR
jgi:hypothetical protein